MQVKLNYKVAIFFEVLFANNKYFRYNLGNLKLKNATNQIPEIGPENRKLIVLKFEDLQ